MPVTFDSALREITTLVEDFRRFEHKYLSPSYTESQARADFIDKFFIALGWDVTHQTQKNPFAQEVKIEQTVATGPAKRRADYAFSIAPRYTDFKFFAEAKQPQPDIATKDNCFQAIRYAWNRQLPLVVLTDFYSFHILDSRYQPNIHTATDRIVRTYNYLDYAHEDALRELYHLFSRDAVANNSISDFVAAHLPKPRPGTKQYALFKSGYRSIDEAFLEQLDHYRTILARTFKQHNSELDGQTLTELVQRTLDRLVFLRFLEDKLIEPQPRVCHFSAKPSPWKEFVTASRHLDSIYNGVVFKRHALLDDPHFKLDEDAFASICDELSDPSSPYDFNSIPVSILGSIYERFLGKVITTTANTAAVQDKPEVRKAGGVFYTPEHVVQYIVEETVGKLIDGKSPEAISKLRFADIACGSGSFLIGTYDYLLRYHEKYFNAHPHRIKPDDCVMREGALHLSLKKKRELLLSTIYGVDIDHQAVEVAQLSLYLKLLEEETTASAVNYQQEIHQAILPPLNKNIICGNSLIELEAIQCTLFPLSEDDERRINAMTFRDQFPGVAKSGGFDAIVGNPPYVRIQLMKEWAPAEVEMLKARFVSAQRGNYDIYLPFVEQGLSLLKKGGRLGFIVPHKFLNSQYGEPLRQILSAGSHVSEIVHFGDLQIFKGATTYTCLLFLTKSPSPRFVIRKVTDLTSWILKRSSVSQATSASALGAKEWNFAVGPGSALFRRLRDSPLKVGDVADIYVGLQTSADPVFILGLVSESGSRLVLRSRALGKDVQLETDLLHPLISGTDVTRYGPLPRRQFILFPYQVEKGDVSLIDMNELRRLYPLAAEYLEQNKRTLQGREKGKFRGKEWHRFGRSQNLGRQEQVKLCVPRLVEELHATLDSSGEYFLDNVDVGGVVWKPDCADHDLKYLLGLLNSRLSRWFFPFVSAPFRGGFRSANRQFLSQMPMPSLKPEMKADMMRARLIADLVEVRLETRRKAEQALSDKDRSYQEARGTMLDRQIDNVVYELFGLSDREIELVESASG